MFWICCLCRLVNWFFVNGFTNFCSSSRYIFTLCYLHIGKSLAERTRIYAGCRQQWAVPRCFLASSVLLYFVCGIARSSIYVVCLPEWHKMNSLKASVSVCRHVNVPAAPQIVDVACVRDLHWKLLVRIELSFLNNNNNNNKNTNNDDDDTTTKTIHQLKDSCMTKNRGHLTLNLLFEKCVAVEIFALLEC